MSKRVHYELQDEISSIPAAIAWAEANGINPSNMPRSPFYVEDGDIHILEFVREGKARVLHVCHDCDYGGHFAVKNTTHKLVAAPEDFGIRAETYYG